jgi:hypothetical protein
VPAQARVPLGHKPNRRLRRDRRVFHRTQSKIIIDVKHKRLCSWVQFPGIPRSVSRSRERQPPHHRIRHRDEWLGKIAEASVRRRTELYCQQLDALRSLHQQARKELLAEGRKHKATKLLRQIPSIGPIRSVLLVALLTQSAARGRESRWIPRLSALSLCGTSQDRVPENLIKLWLGHSQNLIDLYAAQLRYDETYRREWCEKAGLGFELGELGYKSEAPIRPSLVA